MAKWHDGIIVGRKDWNDHLFSLRFSCENFPIFKAGQFTKIGIEQADGKVLSRPYSLVNSPENKYLEIIAVPVAEGSLSPKLHELGDGDAIKVMSPATGFLILDEVPSSQTLFLVATGTGVGPFISILDTTQPWQTYQEIVLVYGVRHANDLAYQDKIKGWQSKYGEQFSFVPIVSRDDVDGALKGRIPQLLAEQKIQQMSGRTLSAQSSQVMMCGNPDMIKDTIDILQSLGLSKHLRRSPGQISMERYW